MLINRRTFKVKMGHTSELVELLRTGANHLDWVPPFRILKSCFGELTEIQLELEFESLADYDRFWSSYRKAVASEKSDNRLHELVNGEFNELWQVL